MRDATEHSHSEDAAIDADHIQDDPIEDELSDVLFCVVNICRHLKIDPETALRRTNHKFERRFRHVEQRFQEQQRDMASAALEEMDRYWDEAKQLERTRTQDSHSS